MKNISFVLLVMLLVSGCSQSQSDISSSTGNLPSQSHESSVDETQTLARNDEEPNPHVPILKDGNIYCAGEKVGKWTDGRIYMKLYDEVVSFIPSDSDLNRPDIQSLGCNYDHTKGQQQYVTFSYLNLEVSPRLYSPYAIYKPIITSAENQKISYRCNGSLALKENPNTNEKAQVPSFYCETNEKDFLTQYEFQATDGTPVLTTGGDVSEEWKKLYLKKISGKNYIFMAPLSSSYEHSFFSGEGDMKKYQRLTEKAFLDELLQDLKIKNSLILWKSMVDSFRVEPSLISF